VSLRSEFRVICFCLRMVVSNTYCVVFLLCLSKSCVPYVASFSDCPFLITPSVFSNVYLKVFDLNRKGTDPTIYRTHVGHTSHYAICFKI